jgi:hypothetical protein
MQAVSHFHNPTGRLAAEHPGLVKVGRAGWFAKGVVYVLAGILALKLLIAAAGWSSSSSASQEASPTGALKDVASTTGGTVLLWALAIGLILYALWRLVSSFLPGEKGAKASATRIGYLVSAVIYGTFAVTAIALAGSKSAAASGNQANGNQKVTDITSNIMSNTAGRWLIGIVGVITIGAAIYRFVKGVKMDVDDELELQGMSVRRIRWTRRLGAIGEIGRGVAIALIGIFLLRAAITYDAAQATGLDGALRRIATNWWGLIAVAIVGIGFVAYGVFCLTTFNRRHLQAP